MHARKQDGFLAILLQLQLAPFLKDLPLFEAVAGLFALLGAKGVEQLRARVLVGRKKVDVREAAADGAPVKSDRHRKCVDAVSLFSARLHCAFLQGANALSICTTMESTNALHCTRICAGSNPAHEIGHSCSSLCRIMDTADAANSESMTSIRETAIKFPRMRPSFRSSSASVASNRFYLSAAMRGESAV